MKKWKNTYLDDFLRLVYIDHTNNVKDIANCLCTTTNSINQNIIRLKIKRKKRFLYQPNPNINHNYFKTWSPNMAYILGFTLADGYVDKNHNCFGFCLSYKDIEILEFISKEFNFIGNIKIKDYNYKKEYRKNDHCFLRIFSRTIKEDLVELGIVSLKTGKEIVPEIPECLFYDFLCGVLDGDGTICTNHPKISICSASRDFVDSIQKTTTMGFTRSDKRGLHYWEVCRKAWRIELFKKLYRPDRFKLYRKFLSII
jgi:hypothetical protein